MPEFPSSPSPARVHGNARAYTGHHPHWTRREYQGGLWRTDHFRTCSYCGSIHPEDLLDLLEAGGSWLEEVRGKPEKRILLTPNPVAGELVCIGSWPAPAFARDAKPRTLRERMLAPAAKGLNPSIGERLAGHLERSVFEPAPSHVPQPIFHEHLHERLWQWVQAASSGGNKCPVI